MIKKFFNTEAGIKKLNRLLRKTNGKKIDNLELFIKDLFEIRHPSLYKKFSAKEYQRFKDNFINKSPSNRGRWIYYPWLNKAYLCPQEKIYFEIFTARNKTLISREEQLNYYRCNIGIVGLSVGQSAALVISRTGGGKNIKLADPDRVSPTNLNRLHVGLPSIGKRKTKEAAKRIYETNPYHRIKLFNQGINPGNIDSFFNKDFKLDVVIDACDHFPTKILLRKKAKKFRLPLIMATDLSDAILIDLERYDQNPEIPIFGGRLEQIKDKKSFINSSVAVIHPDFISPLLQDALFEIGKTIPTHPQLGSGAYFTGVAISYLVRALANKRVLTEKRVYIDLDEYFDPRVSQKHYRDFRRKKIKYLKKIIGWKDSL